MEDFTLLAINLIISWFTSLFSSSAFLFKIATLVSKSGGAIVG